MRHFLQNIKSSCLELKKVSTLTISAMLMAMNIVLGFFTVTVTPVIKIGFSFLTNAVCGMFYGPIVAGLMAGTGDVLKYFLFPQNAGFFPGFTLNAVLGGVIYGLFFYRQKITVWRVFLAKLTVVLVVNIFLGTLWNSILYGQGYWGILPARVIKNLMQLPVDVVLLYTTLKVLCRVKLPQIRKISQ